MMHSFINPTASNTCIIDTDTSQTWPSN